MMGEHPGCFAVSTLLLLVVGIGDPCSAFVVPPAAISFLRDARFDGSDATAACLSARTGAGPAAAALRRQCCHSTMPTRTSLRALKKSQGGMEVGIKTAQILMDPRRRDGLKRSIQKKFPLVPGGAIDVCIDISADAFKTVAPAKLRQALRPGGMEKVRPDIERSIVKFAMKQKVVRDIPLLSHDDKTRLMEAIVDVCLDYLLEDAEEVLAAPEVRLEALEEEMREIKSTMGPWRLLLYRVRNDPVPVAALVALSAALAYRCREDRAMVALTSLVKTRVAPVFAAIGKAIWALVVKMLSWMSVLRENVPWGVR